MTGRLASTHREGLKAARLLMVLSSISPLFVLWMLPPVRCATHRIE